MPLPISMLLKQPTGMDRKTERECTKLLQAEFKKNGVTEGIWNVWVLTHRAKCKERFRAQSIDLVSKPGKTLIRIAVKLKNSAYILLVEPTAADICPNRTLLQLQGQEPDTRLKAQDAANQLAEDQLAVVTYQNYFGTIRNVTQYGVFVKIRGSSVEPLCRVGELTDRQLFPPEAKLTIWQKIRAIEKAGFTVGTKVRFKALGLNKNGQWDISIRAVTKKPSDGLAAYLQNITADGALSTAGWFLDPHRGQMICEIIVELQAAQRVGYIPKSKLLPGILKGLNERFRENVGLGITLTKFASRGHLTRDSLAHNLIKRHNINGELVGYLPTDVAYLEAKVDPPAYAPLAQSQEETDTKVDLQIAEEFYRKTIRLEEIDKALHEAGMLELVRESSELKQWILSNPQAKEQYKLAKSKLATLV